MVMSSVNSYQEEGGGWTNKQTNIRQTNSFFLYNMNASTSLREQVQAPNHMAGSWERAELGLDTKAAESPRFLLLPLPRY